MKKLIYFFIFCLAYCCGGDKHIEFKVTNNSGTEIDSVILTGLGKAKIQSLGNNDTVVTKMDYSQSKTRTDGSYQIKIFGTDYNTDKYFGYYTNGLPICDYNITIESDTIIIKELNHW